MNVSLLRQELSSRSRKNPRLEDTPKTKLNRKPSSSDDVASGDFGLRGSSGAACTRGFGALTLPGIGFKINVYKSRNCGLAQALY